MRKLVLFLCFSTIFFDVQAQDLPPDITDQIEAYLEDQDEEIDIFTLYEQLRIFIERPLNLNKANHDDIQDLGLLSDIQITDLLYHIEKYGPLLSVAELQSIPSFSISDIKRIEHFVQVKGLDNLNISITEMLKQSRNELYLKAGRILEEQRGYVKNTQGESNYIGNPYKYFVRYRNNYNNRLRMGFILEKDPGEAFMQDSKQLGFDYLTAHIYLKDFSQFLQDFVVGDYTVSLGQGLIAHNSFGSGKSAWVTNIKKGGRPINPYNSVNENGYMRGAAARFRLQNNLELSVYTSKVNRDGNAIGVDSLNQAEPEIIFSSLQTSGNHRTKSEIEDKGIFGITSLGGTLKFRRSHFHLALNSLNHRFNSTLQRSDDLYNLFRFDGDHLSNHSMDFSYRYKNYNLFGEIAYSTGGGMAYLAGALLALDRRFNISLLWRNYERDYNAIEPNALGESSTATNENGIYMGMEILLHRDWKIRAYADFWRHPWLRFNIDSPTHGKEFVARIDFTKKRRLNVYLQYTYENKFFNIKTEEGKLKIAAEQIRQRLRLHFGNKVNRNLEFRTRLEFSLFENPQEKENGYLFYQDVIYKPLNKPLSLTARIALFDTDSFDSRIYAFENALLYEFFIPSYFDQGFKYYLNFRYKVDYHLTAELRLARTHYTNRTTFGSANDLIEGDTRTEIRAQIRYVF